MPAAVARAVLALTLGGVLLLTGFVFLPRPAETQLEHHGPGKNQERRILAGRDLQVRIGRASTQGDSLGITGLDGDRALVSRSLSLPAADFPLLEYTIDGKHPGLSLYIIWRNSASPEKLFSHSLDFSTDPSASVDLSNSPGWQGKIIEIGIDLYGDLRGQAVVLHQLTLRGFTPISRLQALWSEWTAFSPWDQGSINHLPGSRTAALPSPTVVALAWVVLSLVLLFAINRLTRQRHMPASYIALVLIPWLLLDGLWQYRLSRQLDESRFLFAGKSQHEKHLSDIDSEIYSYARQLKEYLPAPGSTRIFILHDSDGHEYSRLKTQYYLLPHNVFNFGRTPPALGVRGDDFILALGDNPALRHEASSHVLAWDEGRSLPVEEIMVHPRGRLYRVSEAAASAGTGRAAPQAPDRR